MCYKIKSLYIEKYKGFKDFKIEFNSELNILVGENGTGKTTILEIIYNALSGNIDYFLKDNNFKNIQLELNDNLVVKFLNNKEIYINDEKIDFNNEFFSKKKVLYFIRASMKPCKT